jgi:hypothetical protein
MAAVDTGLRQYDEKGWVGRVLHCKHGRSRSFPAFEIAMRPGGLAQRVGLVDRDFYGSALDHFEELSGGRQKVFSARRVGVQSWPGQEE